MLCAKSLQSCPTLCNPIDCSPPGSSVHGDSPGKNIGVGCPALLQGIFLIQGSNPYLLCLLYYRWILYLWANERLDIINNSGKLISRVLIQRDSKVILTFFLVLPLNIRLLFKYVGLKIPRLWGEGWGRRDRLDFGVDMCTCLFFLK